jgi:NAD-dependent deacetylase
MSEGRGIGGNREASPKEGSSRGKHGFPRGSGPKANDVDARHSTAVEQSVSGLAALVREHQPCVVLTGAGISTESGIPDFRSPTGIWAQYDPMEYATIGAFRRDPVKVWEFYALRFEVLTTAEPNAGHLALAELERRGLVSAVVTQNIDGLHNRAGSCEVVEVHGSIRTSSCLECGERVPLQEVVAALRDAPAAVPRCPRCGSILKPDVVMFGELLPAGAMERAVELAQGAGILLVVGSSLEVYPVAGLPEETVSGGGALAIVNRGATPFDGLASIRIDGGAGETLAALARELLLA